ILGPLLSGGNSIRHTPGLCHFSDIDHDDITAEPVHQAAPSLACEPGDVTDKSVQVRIITHNEASQANEQKTLSTSATQTEPQAVSSGRSTHFP
ncbi:hypothetical protein MTO96_039478, partial [Rhipicephalus appendiculatus]